LNTELNLHIVYDPVNAAWATRFKADFDRKSLADKSTRQVDQRLPSNAASITSQTTQLSGHYRVCVLHQTWKIGMPIVLKK